MSRLTTRNEDGRAALKLENPKTEKEARKQLHDKFLLAVEKLARYEDLEEVDPETGLKPCPFCGGNAETNLFLGNYCVTCTNCSGSIFPAKGMRREEAIAAWNRRQE